MRDLSDFFPDSIRHREFDTDESRQQEITERTNILDTYQPYLDALQGAVLKKRIEINEFVHGDQEDTVWQDQYQDSLIDRLKKVGGPLIEAGGPTKEGYALVDVARLPKKLITTNIVRVIPEFTGFDSTDSGLRPDVQTDVRAMPLRDSGVGALFVSCLGGLPKFNRDNNDLESRKETTEALRGHALKEAWRIIEDGGYLVWQGGKKADIAQALDLGFHPVTMDREMYYSDSGHVEEVWHVVMQKPLSGAVAPKFSSYEPSPEAQGSFESGHDKDVLEQE